MHLLAKAGIAAATLAVAAAALSVATPAMADSAARPGDVVGVGSDTLQNAADFVFDGSPGVVGGYNTANNLNRVFNFFATGDANGRATYDGTCGATTSATGLGTFCGSTTNQAPNSLAASVILRDGTKPVIRPNGSGGGIAALEADAAAPGYEGLPVDSIQFARASRLPNSTEETNCPTTSACGGLHVFQAATDDLGIARVSSGFNGPAGLSAQELVSIYTCQTTTWNALPGFSSGSTDTIHPLIPQSGSGTRTFFLQDLQTLTGASSAITPGSCVRTVQEHDPTGIYADSSPGDAIEPFSKGKISLINSGYFANGEAYCTSSSPCTVGAQGAYTPNFLKLETGTPGDSHANYTSTRGVYFVVRQPDVVSTTPFQTGSTQNFTDALFASPTSAIQSAAGQAEITAAGFTPDYVNCGINPTTC